MVVGDDRLSIVVRKAYFKGSAYDWIAMAAVGLVFVVAPPKSWIQTILGGALAVFLFLHSFYYVYVTRVTITESNVTVTDEFWPTMTMARDRITEIRRTRRHWEIRSVDGDFLRVRLIFTRKEVARLADLLRVPIADDE